MTTLPWGGTENNRTIERDFKVNRSLGEEVGKKLTLESQNPECPILSTCTEGQKISMSRYPLDLEKSNSLLHGTVNQIYQTHLSGHINLFIETQKRQQKFHSRYYIHVMLRCISKVKLKFR